MEHVSSHLYIFPFFVLTIRIRCKWFALNMTLVLSLQSAASFNEHSTMSNRNYTRALSLVTIDVNQDRSNKGLFQIQFKQIFPRESICIHLLSLLVWTSNDLIQPDCVYAVPTPSDTDKPSSLKQIQDQFNICSPSSSKFKSTRKGGFNVMDPSSWMWFLYVCG